MATFSAKIFKHHKKEDGTYNVKICVYHNGKRVFIDTVHYVVDKQITKSLKIKDDFIISALNRILDGYRKSASDLGERLSLFTADNLKQYLLNKDIKVD